MLLRRTMTTTGGIFHRHNMGQRTRKDIDINDSHNQGNYRRATTMADPSASPAADADSIKDEDARETK